jgi:cobalt-zinc-cadmium efflux system outer membrane protein
MRSICAAATAALLLAGSAGAQDAQTLTEADFLAPLDAVHPAAAVLREDLGLAEAAVLGAHAVPNPELGATHEAPGDAEQLDLTLSWRPPHPGRRRLAVAAADSAVGAARARLAADHSALRQTMREAYARWAIATAASVRLVGHVEQVDRLAQRERQRADAGEASGLDARRLALAASGAHAELARAEAERLRARAGARQWRPDLPPNATPTLPPLPEPTADPAREHPRIVALRADLEAARLTERLAARVVELPEVVGGWQRQESPGVEAEGPMFGLAWPLPLLDRRRGERAAARVRVEGLEARLALAEREIAAARTGALAAYRELRTAALAASEAATSAPGVVGSATAAFHAGEVGLTDLLETLHSATDAELGALALRAEALAALRELESATAIAESDSRTGEPPPDPSPDDH